MKNSSKKRARYVEKCLIEKYGLLMRLRNVADEMGVSQESLRSTMRRAATLGVQYLKRHKLRFGRRIRYPARAVAESLVLDNEELHELMRELDEGGLENVA